MCCAFAGQTDAATH